MLEIYSVTVLRAEAREAATLEVVESDSHHARLLLRLGTRIFEADARDCFDALQQLRRKLAQEGLDVFCYGASRDVWPSGMGRSMGGGRKAYRTALGQSAQGPLLQIFESGPDIDLVSVEEQESFHQRWIASLQSS